MGDQKTCVYQFTHNENDSDDTKIIQHFIMRRLELCIKVDSYAAHMFYVWSFSNNESVTIAIKKNKFFLSLNIKTTVFLGNLLIPIKIGRKNQTHQYEKTKIKLV